MKLYIVELREGSCAAACNKTVLSHNTLISLLAHAGSQAAERHTGTKKNPVVIHLMLPSLPVRAQLSLRIFQGETDEFVKNFAY